MTPIHERQRDRFLSTKSKKNGERSYIYKKQDMLQKERQFALSFYSQKARHFTLRDFS